jgi:type VI secretion system protein ImpK
MKLLEVCEPVFLYVCVLNRAAKADIKGADFEHEKVRSNIEQMLANMLSRAGADLHLQEQIRRIELPLIFFVDSFISESRLDFATQWNSNRLAFKHNEHAGDEKFFKLLDDTLQEHTLKDKSADASERLSVFFVCLGLGFRGIYGDSPPRRRQYIDDIGRLISSSMDRDWEEEIIKDHFVDTTNLVAPPSQKLVLIVILFLCFTCATMIGYIWTFLDASHTLSTSITTIVNNAGQ